MAKSAILCSEKSNCINCICKGEYSNSFNCVYKYENNKVYILRSV